MRTRWAALAALLALALLAPLAFYVSASTYRRRRFDDLLHHLNRLWTVSPFKLAVVVGGGLLVAAAVYLVLTVRTNDDS